MADNLRSIFVLPHCLIAKYTAAKDMYCLQTRYAFIPVITSPRSK